MHKPIGIVSAMREELAPLLRGVRASRAKGVDLFELKHAVVGIGGIGREPGRRAAEAVLSFAHPELLVAAGIAGAVSHKLKVGDVGWAREVIDGETGERFAAQAGDWLVVSSTTVSAAEEKKKLLAQYGADAVDMEGAAVAVVAREHGIEFAAVKAISDEADFAMPPFSRFIDEGGKFAVGRFAAYIAVRPRWWSAVASMRSNSRRAAMKLCCELGHLMERYSNPVQEENVSLS